MSPICTSSQRFLCGAWSRRETETLSWLSAATEAEVVRLAGRCLAAVRLDASRASLLSQVPSVVSDGIAGASQQRSHGSAEGDALAVMPYRNGLPDHDPNFRAPQMPTQNLERGGSPFALGRIREMPGDGMPMSGPRDHAGDSDWQDPGFRDQTHE